MILFIVLASMTSVTVAVFWIYIFQNQTIELQRYIRDRRAILSRLEKFTMIVCLFVGLGLAGCGGGSTKTPAPPPPPVTPSPVSIAVNPPSATLVPGGRQQFTANVTMSDGTVTNNANFAASGAGTVDSKTGIFTASASDGPATVTANAGSLFMDASVAVVSPTSPGPAFVQAVACGKGLAATCNLTATQGNAFVFFLHGDSLPDGVAITLTDSLNNQFLTTLATAANSSASSGLAEFGVAWGVAGGADVLNPPTDSVLVVLEYSGATSLDAFTRLEAGPIGSPTQTLYNDTVVTSGVNETALVFILGETTTAINAGAGDTERFQTENGTNLSILVQDVPAPLAGPYTLSFSPATPAAFNSTQTMLATLVLRP